MLGIRTELANEPIHKRRPTTTSAHGHFHRLLRFRGSSLRELVTLRPRTTGRKTEKPRKVVSKEHTSQSYTTIHVSHPFEMESRYQSSPLYKKELRCRTMRHNGTSTQRLFSPFPPLFKTITPHPKIATVDDRLGRGDRSTLFLEFFAALLYFFSYVLFLLFHMLLLSGGKPNREGGLGTGKYFETGHTSPFVLAMSALGSQSQHNTCTSRFSCVGNVYDWAYIHASVWIQPNNHFLLFSFCYAIYDVMRENTMEY